MANNSLLGSFGDLSNSGLMFRNRIINGNFDIWQRGTSQTSSGYDSDDRWFNQHDGSTKTASRQSFTLGQTDVPNNPKYFSRTVVTSAAGAGNYVVKSQSIESVSTLAGQTVTLSFWAKADASKNIAIEFGQVFGTGGSPSSTITGVGVTTCALTTSWKKFTITTTLPSISGKVLGSDNNDKAFVVFWFDAGSSFNSRTNSLGQQSGTFDIAQVQLEGGPVATPFEMRPVGTELALCQRYYQKIKISSNTYLGTVGYNSNIWGQTLSMPTMRKVPLGTSGGETILWVIPGLTIHTTTKGTDISVGATENTFFITQSVTSASSGISNGAQYCFEVGNASSLSINLDAEL